MKESATRGPVRRARRHTGINLNSTRPSSTWSPSHIERRETRIFLWKPTLDQRSSNQRRIYDWRGSGRCMNWQSGGGGGRYRRGERAPIFVKNLYLQQLAKSRPLICSRGVRACSPGKIWNLRRQMTHYRPYFGQNMVVFLFFGTLNRGGGGGGRQLRPPLDPPLDCHLPRGSSLRGVYDIWLCVIIYLTRDCMKNSYLTPYFDDRWWQVLPYHVVQHTVLLPATIPDPPPPLPPAIIQSNCTGQQCSWKGGPE